MFGKFLSELLILILIILVCSRFLYINKLQFDALSALAVAIFPFSLLVFCAWGFSFFTACITGISFLVFLCNIGSYSRYRRRLAFDHYSIPFLVISILNILLSLFLLVMLIAYRPVKQNLEKNHILKESVTFTGNFTDGFKKSISPFHVKNAILTKYFFHEEKMQSVPQELLDKVEKQKIFKNKPDLKKILGEDSSKDASSNSLAENNSQTRKIILFLPSKAACQEDYIPLFKELAKSGFTIYTCEFYTKDQPYFNSFLDSRLFRHRFIQYKNIFNLQKIKCSVKDGYLENELSALLNFVDAKREDTIYLVGDKDSSNALLNVHNKNFSLIDATYDISTISAYSTAGYGFIEQMEPLLAAQLNLKRESSDIYAASIATILLNELAFNGQLNSFTLQQMETDYSKEQNVYQGFGADTSGTLEIAVPDLELE